MFNRVKEDPRTLGTVSIKPPFITGYSVVTL